MEEILRRGLAELALDVPEGAIAGMCAYGALLLEKNEVVNLTAIRDPEGVARLHFLDCAALLKTVELGGKRVLDVGSGAGFPGVPLKLLCPTAELTMVDSVGKKMDFVREACAAIGLEAECRWGRIEEMPELRESFDAAVSRAVAELDVLAELCLPQVKTGGLFVAMKGPDCEDEVERSDFAIRTMGGRVREIVRYAVPGTDVIHSAVIVEKRKPTPPQYPRRYAQMKKKPLRG